MQKSRNNLYEGMYILSATLSEEARKKAIEKISNSIQEHEGKVHKLFEQGRKRLAYEIDGRKEGYYFVLYFTVGSATMPKLWSEYKLNEDLLRFMTLRSDKVPEKIEFKPLEKSE